MDHLGQQLSRNYQRLILGWIFYMGQQPIIYYSRSKRSSVSAEYRVSPI